ncbi:GH92 family glycosyl hydrolase [Kosmotoga sp.]|uniref:GH92 family glycosyl hydrolase n=1 Tax=Kosmotoga sp. TaxID=1955248 RepID=UPI0025901922|nr:GH92 family glycosyl hydrolase [Kosmotoga sp.]
MKSFFVSLMLVFSIISPASVLDYVDPFIGTGGHGHTFPGATVPFGMVQLSPDTDIKGWDWCSGYHYSDSSIMGFSHTHLSGTGAADYGEIRIMPIVGNLKTLPGPKDDPDGGYRSRFRHETEIAKPGYYSVFLDDYGILAELTASTRVGVHRYTFPKTDEAYIILDLYHRIGDMAEKAWVKIVGNDEIEGYITGGHFCGARSPHTIYFVAKFSKPFEEFGTWKVFRTEPGNREEKLRSRSEPFVGAYVRYSTEENEKIIIKVAVSYTGIEGARKNLSEVPDWDFDRVKKEAFAAWVKELNKIEVEGKIGDKIKFYTALYHSFIAPNIFSDIDGKYIGPDDKVHSADYPHYTVFSLWDTFRALHPLFVLLQPERNVDMIKSLLDIYDQSGWLPKWYKANRFTNCMIGTHADSVIAVAYVKGLEGFDLQKAYKAMLKNATKTSRCFYEARGGLKYYIKKGYVPADRVGEATSRTLEFAYNDFCIAQFAKKLGKLKDYEKFMERSKNYKNVFDRETGFMRGRKYNGRWMDENNFDPAKVYKYFTEGNSWQWTFFVVSDMYGLIGLMGGKEAFSKKLDRFFSEDSNVDGPPDITGLIGQYAHGNEPSHHAAYLYVYANEPWKTQKMVRYIMDNLYQTGPEGLCGNDDCGQMSAWYVFSAMGFYPVCPGTPYYVIGSPIFNKVVVHLNNKRDFEIVAKNNSKDNLYISRAILNDKEIKRAWINHEEIIKGTKLVFEMSAKPDFSWGLENVPME